MPPRVLVSRQADGFLRFHRSELPISPVFIDRPKVIATPSVNSHAIPEQAFEGGSFLLGILSALALEGVAVLLFMVARHVWLVMR
jgi:hypothetical protein